MRRKKTPVHVNHERWLVSYADFITLLFAFFVVLFATGQSDKIKKIELARSIKSAFQEMGVFDGRSDSAMALGAGALRTEPAPGTGTSVGDPEREALKQRLRKAGEPDVDSKLIGIYDTPNGLVISLQEAGFFESGAADVRVTALPVLNRIAAALPDGSLRVEGHTDDVPIRTAEFASNWELSSARASGVARLLLQHDNVRPEMISVSGYAEFHPVASNQTAEGRMQNRRVDIVILNSTK